MYDPRQWAFVADMNFSGSITISDVWLWFKWLYFYPGDGFVYFLFNKIPDVGHFFEITYSSYGGVLSGIVSFCVWITATFILWVILIVADDILNDLGRIITTIWKSVSAFFNNNTVQWSLIFFAACIAAWFYFVTQNGGYLVALIFPALFALFKAISLWDTIMINRKYKRDDQKDA
jgi:hypothetical protein